MSAQDPSEKHHSSFRDKIRGAAHVVHGMGENIRGSMMGAVESVSGSEDAKAREEEIVSKGRSEIEQGVAQMKGTPTSGVASTTAAEPQVGTKTGGQPQPQAQQQQPAKQGATQAPAPPEPTQATVGTEARQTESGQKQAAQIDPKSSQPASETQPDTGEGFIGKVADAPQGAVYE